MKKIGWITPSYFVETDIYIIPLIAQEHKVDWYIFVTNNEKLQFQNEIASLRENKNVSIHIEYIEGRQRSFTTLKGLYKLLTQVKRNKYDLVYTAMSGYPYFTPLVYAILGSRRSVIAAHNVTTPKGVKNYRLAQLYTWFTLKAFRNFQTFSINQYDILKQKYPNKKVFYSPFILKDYGQSDAQPGDTTTFLSFGYIRDYKRIDVLIQAAEKAYAEIQKPFLVKIAGKCEDWEKYQKLIKTPSLFDLQIESIPNSEIPHLFGRSHYFVTPYQDIAQSGSLIVGINYEKPIIASDLDSFREYIHEGQNGYLMKPASIDDLARIIKHIVLNHNEIYPALHEGMKQTKEEFNEEKIARRYIQFFQEEVL